MGVQGSLFEYLGCLAPDMARMSLRGIILSIWVAWPSDVARIGHLGDAHNKTRAQLQDMLPMTLLIML